MAAIGEFIFPGSGNAFQGVATWSAEHAFPLAKFVGADVSLNSFDNHGYADAGFAGYWTRDLATNKDIWHPLQPYSPAFFDQNVVAVRVQMGIGDEGGGYIPAFGTHAHAVYRVWVFE